MMDALNPASGFMTCGVNKGVECWDNDKGEHCSEGKTKNHSTGHRTPPLAGLTDPGDFHFMEIIGNASHHG